MRRKIEAILSLVPDAKVIVHNDVITWSEEPSYKPSNEEIEAEMVRLEETREEREAQALAKYVAKRQSALNKLMALGLTEEEALALGVK
jgi:hypothetical protein